MRQAWLLVLLLAISAPAHADDAPPTTRALLVALNETLLSSQMAGRIERIAVAEGERFKRGQILVAFDCAIQRAHLQKARAEQEAAEHVLTSQRKLRELHSGSDLEASLAEASLAKAKAEVAIINATLEQCEIHAPYDGRVVERKARSHESVGAGQPLLLILDDSALEIRLILPSLWLTWFKPGQAMTLHVEENNKDYPIRATKFGAMIDSASQSLKVTAQLTGRFPELMPGMSGTAKVIP